MEKRWNELELLKEEFKSKFQETNPLLTNLTLWCLEHEYEARPDFIDLENQAEKIEFNLQNRPLISDIIPIDSGKTVGMKTQSVVAPKEKQYFLEIENPENYFYESQFVLASFLRNF